MSYVRFILWDGMAALVSAPVLVYLGYHFGDELDWLVKRVQHGQTRVIAGLLAVVAAWFVWTRLRRRRISREVADAVTAVADAGRDGSPASSNTAPASTTRAAAPRARI
jgi:hypothetical protein